MLPPNQFTFIDGRTIVEVGNVEDARWHYKTCMSMDANKRKHCKYLDGALYKDIFWEVADVIEVKDGEQLNNNANSFCIPFLGQRYLCAPEMGYRAQSRSKRQLLAIF